MKLGIVIGNVVATRKVDNVEGKKILVVRYLNDEFMETGTTHACIDTVQAGEGDVVLLCASSSARLTETTRSVATDCTIVGIVDAVTSGSRPLYQKHHTEGR
jgi:microcompartment protein CcmK/EutM